LLIENLIDYSERKVFVWHLFKENQSIDRRSISLAFIWYILCLAESLKDGYIDTECMVDVKVVLFMWSIVGLYVTFGIV